MIAVPTDNRQKNSLGFRSTFSRGPCTCTVYTWASKSCNVFTLGSGLNPRKGVGLQLKVFRHGAVRMYVRVLEQDRQA